MKKISLLVCLVLGFGYADAQGFFYIDGNRATDNVLRAGLVSAYQHISVSPLSSDYIIKADVGFQSSENELTLQINMKDSVTFQTIFQNKEIYTFRELNANSRLMLRTVIRAFIERNIPQIVLTAGQRHDYELMNSQKARKDRT
jgi:hypothetical protein